MKRTIGGLSGSACSDRPFPAFFQARFPDALRPCLMCSASQPGGHALWTVGPDRQDLCGLALERRTFGSSCSTASRNATATTASRKAACCLDRPAPESALQFIGAHVAEVTRPDGVRGRSLEGGREGGGPSVGGGGGPPCDGIGERPTGNRSLCPGWGDKRLPPRGLDHPEQAMRVPSGVGPMALSALEDRSTTELAYHYAPRVKSANRARRV